MDLLAYKHVPKDPRKNILFRRKLIERGFADPGYARAIRDICAQDLLFYINTFGVTYNPKIPKCPAQLFITYEFQDELAHEINQAIDCEGSQDILVEKSRDMGVSWVSLVTLEHRWHFKSLQSFVLGSRNEDYVDKTGESKSLFWKIDFFHKYQPIWMLPTGRFLGDKDPNRTHMRLTNADNGSTISGEASGPNFARGDRRTAAFHDEFAADDRGAEASASSADVTDCRIFNSTPKGTGNEFYRIRSTPDAAKILTYHWSLHPNKSKGLYKSVNGRLEILDEEYSFPRDYEFILDGKLRSPWYDHESKRRPAWQVAQELDINYQGAGKQFYNSDVLEEVQREYCHDPYHQGELAFNFDSNDTSVKFREDGIGRLKLWTVLGFDQKPDMNANYTVGCDIATGKGGTLSTNSVASVTNNLTGVQVAEFATNQMTPTEFAEYVIAICRYFHGAFLIWEDNGPGGEFGKKIKHSNYPYYYYRKNNEKSKITGKRHVAGWWSNGTTKRELLSFFGEQMLKRRYIPRSEAMVEECKDYVFDKGGKIVHSHSKGSASVDESEIGDNHGDRVIAAALSVHAIEEQPSQPENAPVNKPIEQIPQNCLAYREYMKAEMARESELEDWS